MIRNARQYKIAKEQADEFRGSLDQSRPKPNDMPSAHAMLDREALKAQLDMLDAELKEFKRSLSEKDGKGLVDGQKNSYNREVSYSVAQAKNKLPELIKQAEAGARVTITKRGIPVVEILRKTEDSRPKRNFGVLGDKKVVVDPNWARPQADFDAWLAGDV